MTISMPEFVNKVSRAFLKSEFESRDHVHGGDAGTLIIVTRCNHKTSLFIRAQDAPFRGSATYAVIASICYALTRAIELEDEG